MSCLFSFMLLHNIVHEHFLCFLDQFTMLLVYNSALKLLIMQNLYFKENGRLIPLRYVPVPYKVEEM